MGTANSEVVLITGATSGFGKITAEYLAERGFRVYGTGRRVPDTVCGLPGDKGIRHIRMDVSDAASVEQGVAKVIRDAGRIDVLVNNAGTGIAGALELASDDEIRLQMDTNFYGTANLCRYVLPYMRRQRSGKIICVSSIAGIMAVPYQGYYSASKFAIEGFCEALAIETGRFGIKVCLIEPGDFRTGFTAARRISEATLDEPDYADSFRKTLSGIERDEQAGSDPIKVARLVCRLIRKKNPRFRNLTGPFIQTSFARIAPLLPSGTVRHLLRLFYSIPSCP